MTLEELRAKLAKIDGKMRAMLDENPDGLSDELKASYDALETEFDETRSDLEAAEKREKKAQERASYMNQNQRNPLVEKPMTEVRTEQDKEKQLYREAFWATQRRKNITEPMERALQVGTDSEGGYIVPQEFQTTLVTALEDENVFRGLASVVTTMSTKNIPLENTRGDAGWVDEEGAYPESDPVFGKMQLGAHKLGRIIKVSEELLNDSFINVEAYIAQNFARSFGAAEEAAFVNGDGTGKPRGVLLDAANGVTAASATAITADEIIDLFHSVKSGYRQNGTWLMNDSTAKLLRKLKDSNGQYIWQPGMQAGVPDMLLGRPVAYSSSMPAVATGVKSIAFGDFGYYQIGDRGAVSMQRLNELYAANGQVGFRMHKRVDGRLTLTEAVKTLTQA